MHAASSPFPALGFPFLKGEVGVPSRSKELPGGVTGARRHALTNNTDRTVNSIDHRKAQTLNGLDIKSSYRIRKAGAADVGELFIEGHLREDLRDPLFDGILLSSRRRGQADQHCARDGTNGKRFPWEKMNFHRWRGVRALCLSEVSRITTIEMADAIQRPDECFYPGAQR